MAAQGRQTRRTAALDAGPVLALDIERLAGSGDGVAHSGGKVVFVAATAPGDAVEARIFEERASFCRARLERVLRPSPLRVAPPCPVFGACGGCSWQHLAAGAQLDAKRSILADALRRVGRLEPRPVPPVVPSPRPYGYRHRALLHCSPAAGGHAIGFYRPGTREIVPIEGCPVLVPLLSRVLAAIARAARSHPRSFEGCATVRADADWEGAVARLVPADAAGAPLALPADVGAAVRAAGGGSVALWPEPVELRLGPGGAAPVTTGGAFTQVNLAQNEALVRTAIDLAAPAGGEETLDLFCGLGNLSVPAGRRGARVLGVDLDRLAVDLAAANARRAGVDAATFRAADAAEAARELAAAGRRFPLVLLNPPRTGARAVVAQVPALGAERVVYVSCDPATLARDAAVLEAGGYRIAALRALDLFPQTPLVETVALLRRARP